MPQISSFNLLTYKPLARQDLKQLLRLYQQEAFMRSYGKLETKQQTLKQLEFWYDEYEQKRVEFYYSIFFNETWVGFMTLGDFNKSRTEAWLSIGICPEFWGNGIGSHILKRFINDCFTKGTVKMIRLSVFASNERALRLYVKMGFKIEKIYFNEQHANQFESDIYQLYLIHE